MLSSILKADSAGPAVRHVYEKSHLILAAATPVAALSSQDTALRTVADYGLALSIPVHSHIAMNYVIADYVPKTTQGLARWGILGLSAITFAGLLKLNVSGAGVTQTVKDLWSKQ